MDLGGLHSPWYVPRRTQNPVTSTWNVEEALNRPLEGGWPYLWLDATDVKVREAGRIVSKAMIVAVAVNTDGRREVLDLAIGPSETEAFWTDFLRGPMRRGPRCCYTTPKATIRTTSERHAVAVTEEGVAALGLG